MGRPFSPGEVIAWAQHVESLAPAIMARGWPLTAMQPETETNSREYVWALQPEGSCHVVVDAETRVIFAIFTGPAAQQHFEDVRGEGLLFTWETPLKELREASSPDLQAVFIDALGLVAPLEPQPEIVAALHAHALRAVDRRLLNALLRTMARLQWPQFVASFEAVAARPEVDADVREAVANRQVCRG
ncbi:MAG: hypothetical protein DI536_23070 [Archangium gephyra]|uniref:Uncharacterized protein n=1 Tax=Archangium gephyra TaxID=48 RepID=A0A2W5T555_9BACT|nr:MAG: hypothetical protein DI536_23070 [Archangium gephyra]